METCFDHWKKDVFFDAAEEVQESADRMESVYRQWIRESELRRELCAALSTAKWQLDELERAMMAKDEAGSAGKEVRDRHSEFVEAIGSRINMVENAVKEMNFEGEMVRLDEGERDELARFLSFESPELEKMPLRAKFLEMNGEAGKDWLRKEGMLHGQRRWSCSNTDTDACIISISSSEDKKPNVPPKKIPKILSVPQLSSKMKWSTHGFRKWKGGDQQNDEELSPDIDASYERGKSFLSNYAQETYDRQLQNGCVGALHRHLQRSLYQVQYGPPLQMIFWIILIVLLVVELAFCAVC